MINIPISIYCPFCHKYTSLTLAPGNSPGNISSQFKEPVVRALWMKNEYEKWWIGICNSCHNAVLVHQFNDVINIYPNPLPSPTDERIPEHIKKDIDEAKLCFNVRAYRACAVMARRAIQNACIDKGANKDKNLKSQIEELAANKVITNNLMEWATVVRWVGNDAAHPDKDNEVTKEDASDILQLAEQFMHVIYVAPAIAKEMLTKRKK